METTTIAGAVILAVVTALYLVFSSLFLLRRHRHPIKGREVMMILGINISNMAYYSQVVLQRIMFPDSYPCIAFVLIYCLAILLGVQLYLFRAMHLLFQHEITDKVLAIRSGQSASDLGWYVTHRWLVSRSFLQKLSALMFTVDVILIFLVLIGQSSLTGPCRQAPTLTMISLLFIAVHSIFLAIIAYKLRGRDLDGRGIKFELKWTACLMLLLVIIFFFLELTASNVAPYIASWAPPLVLLSLGTIYPLWLSLLRNQTTTVSTADRIPFENVLGSKVGCSYFLSHLKSEFSAENLLFYERVKAFRLTPQLQTIENVHSIISEFVLDSSPFQVNLSGIVSDEIKRREETLTEADDLSNVFTEAEHEIYGLMADDPYKRWLTKPTYVDFFKAYQQEQLQDIREDVKSLLSSSSPIHLDVEAVSAGLGAVGGAGGTGGTGGSHGRHSSHGSHGGSRGGGGGSSGTSSASSSSASSSLPPLPVISSPSGTPMTSAREGGGGGGGGGGEGGEGGEGGDGDGSRENSRGGAEGIELDHRHSISSTTQSPMD